MSCVRKFSYFTVNRRGLISVHGPRQENFVPKPDNERTRKRLGQYHKEYAHLQPFYRKVPKFSDARKVRKPCCNQPKVQTKMKYLLIITKKMQMEKQTVKTLIRLLL